ncbi:MAG: HD-GYP domain-containing protein [Fimbriimonadales bacterium]|nr:HD-GYP domain-containing protein [Fimbriimonadales bacterium]MDW8051876.1 HD-GYP domain-containing protein [Armatimonadota bacterium]
MPKRRRFWLWSGLLGGAASLLLVVAGVPFVHQHQLGAFVAIVVLATAAELLLVRYPLRPEYPDRGVWLSVSTPVVVATILAYGWQFGVWLDAIVSLVAGLFTMHLKSTRARWVFVNTAQSILSAAAAGLVALLFHSVPTSVLSMQGIGALVAGLAAYMLVNTLLVSITIAIAESARLSWVLGQTLLCIPRDVLLMVPISTLIAVVLAVEGAFGLLGVLVPYLALRQAFVIWAHQQALYHQTIRSLGFLVQRAHPYTGGHLQRVARWARRVAERLGLPPERCELIYEAALLHDLGKTVLDERILNKPTRLTPEEWEQIKKHPQLGAEILSDTPFLSPIAPWIALHHERPDGKGYPFGLQGEQIPLEARLIAVVDAFDAMIGGEAPNQHRLHRRPLSVEEALKELERGAGTQFDPQVVQVFKQIVREWQQQEPLAGK